MSFLSSVICCTPGTYDYGPFRFNFMEYPDDDPPDRELPDPWYVAHIVAGRFMMTSSHEFLHGISYLALTGHGATIEVYRNAGLQNGCTFPKNPTLNAMGIACGWIDPKFHNVVIALSGPLLNGALNAVRLVYSYSGYKASANMEGIAGYATRAFLGLQIFQAAIAMLDETLSVFLDNEDVRTLAGKRRFVVLGAALHLITLAVTVNSVIQLWRGAPETSGYLALPFQRGNSVIAHF